PTAAPAALAARLKGSRREARSRVPCPRVRHAFLALFLASAAALAQSRAPLGARTQGPLRELFLDMTGAAARSLPSPELDLRYTVPNTWHAEMSVITGPHGYRT